LSIDGLVVARFRVELAIIVVLLFGLALGLIDSLDLLWFADDAVNFFLEVLKEAAKTEVFVGLVLS
jgi:hypothetical protein